MSKKRAFLALMMAAVLCLGLLLTGCGKQEPEKAPADQLSYSLDKTVTAIAGRMPDVGAIGDSLKKGKVSIDALGVLENVMYIDSEAGFFADYLHFGQGENGIDLSLFMKDQALAVNFPMIFGDQAYGVDLSTLEEDLKGCAVWEVLGTTYEEFMENNSLDLGALTGGATDTLDQVGELQKAVDEAVADIEITSKLDKAQIGGEETEAIVVSWQMTSGDIKELVDIYVDWMEKNMQTSVADLAGDTYGQIGDIKTEMDDYFSKMDLTLSVDVNIDPETEYVMSIDGRVNGTVDGEPGDIKVSLVLGKDPAATDEFTFTVSSMDADQVKASVEARLKVEDTDSNAAVVLTVDSNEGSVSQRVLDASLTYDKQSQKFSLDVDADGSTFGMEGMLRYKEDVFQLYIASVEADGEETVLDITVSFEAIASGELPEMPGYTDLTELPAEQWQSLIMMLSYMSMQS